MTLPPAENVECEGSDAAFQAVFEISLEWILHSLRKVLVEIETNPEIQGRQ